MSRRGRPPRSNRALILGVVAVAIVAGAIAAVIHWTSAPVPQAAPPGGPPAGLEPGGKTRGRADAPVTIEVFSDFLCSHCVTFALTTEPAIIREFVEPGIAKLVYRHFIVISRLSQFLAEASECAADQRRFWAYHDIVMARSARRALQSADDVEATAREAGLDLGALATCRPQPSTSARVQADMTDGERRGVRATPTIFINGQMLQGAQPIEAIRAAVDAARGR